MTTKILVLGSTGMLGHMVLKVLSREKKLRFPERASQTPLIYFTSMLKKG